MSLLRGRWAWLTVLVAVAAASFAPISSSQLPEPIRPWVSFGHLPAYALLTGLTLRRLLQANPGAGFARAAWLTFVLMLGASVLIEWLQPYVGRSRDTGDGLLNLLGVAATLTFLAVRRRRRLRGELSRS